MTSKVAILMYVAIFAVLGQAMAQTCPTSVTLTANSSTACTVAGTNSATVTLTATLSGPTGLTANGFGFDFYRNGVLVGTVTSTNTTGTTQTFTDVNAPIGTDTYDVVVHQSGCTNVLTAGSGTSPVVVVSGSPVLQSFTNSGPICSGGTATLTFVVTGLSSGSITLNYYQSAPVTGSTIPITVTANGSGTTTITTTSTVLTQATTYSIASITTSNGCTATTTTSNTTSTTVTVNSGPTITNVISPQPVCQGGTLQISANVPAPTGGTNVFAWFKNGILIGSASSSGTQTIPTGSGSTMVLDFSNPLVPSITINNVQPSDGGNYVLQVCNSTYSPCTCSYSNVVTPVINTLPTATFTTTSPQTVCYGSGTTLSGTYSSTASSVIIQYSINGGAPQTVTGTGGTFSIPVPGNLVSGSSNSVAITSITSSGTNGCVNTVLLPNPITVNVQNQISFGAITLTNAGVFSCSYSTLTANVAGATSFPAGTTSITYRLTSPLGYNQTATTTTSPSNSVSFSNLTGQVGSSTTYTLVATSAASGCTATTTFTVGAVPSPISLTNLKAAPIISCNNGTTTVTGSVSGGTAGYTVMLNGLSGTTSVGPITVNAGLFTQTNVPAGNYSVVVTDANGCTSTAQTLNIFQPAPIVVTASAGVSAVSCYGSTTVINVTATGGSAAGTYTYTLSGGPTSGTLAARAGTTTSTFSNIAVNYPSSTYTITATDVNGCTGTAQVTITSPQQITGSSAVAQPTCPGGTASITVTVTGGGVAPFRYSLTGANTNTQSSATFTNLLPGTYTPTIIDANGCMAILSAVPINAIPAITANVNFSSIACNGSSTTINISSLSGGNGNTPITYSISGFTAAGTFTTVTTNTSNSITPVFAGTYSITANNPGCPAQQIGSNLTSPSSLGTVVISQPTAQTVSFTATTLTCNASTSTVTLTATGGTAAGTASRTYQLVNASNSVVVGTNNTGVFSGVLAGTYNYVVTDASGCITQSNPSNASTQITIAAVTPVVLNTPAVTAATCYGGYGSIAIRPTGGSGSYTVNLVGPAGYTATLAGTSTVTFNNLLAGTYTITATDTNGCSTSGTGTVATVTQPAATAGGQPNLVLAASADNNVFAPPVSIVTLTNQVNNVSGNAATSVTLRIFKPTPFYTITLAASATGWSQVTDNSSYTEFRYTGQLACLGSAGSSISVQTVVTRTATATGKGVFPVTVTVYSAVPDSNPSDNSAGLQFEAR